MTDNVVQIGVRDVGDAFIVEPDAVLDGAKGRCEFIIVIGRSKDGGPPYVACSHGQPEALAEIEVAKHWMLSQIAEARSDR